MLGFRYTPKLIECKEVGDNEDSTCKECDCFILVSPPKCISTPDSRSSACLKGIFNAAVLISFTKIVSLSSDSIKNGIEVLKSIDAGYADKVSLVPQNDVPGKRFVLSPTGLLNRCYDDQRRWYDAGYNGLKRALEAGSKSPMLMIDSESLSDQLCAVIGAYKATYVSFQAKLDHEMRNSSEIKDKAARSICLCCVKSDAKIAEPIEKGLIVARDLAGTDPEVMTPKMFAKYLKKEFEDSCVTVTITEGQATFEKEFPCLAAVNRGVAHTEYSNNMHGARVVELNYEGEGPITKTLYLIGKGVCYDSGGHDLKIDGTMAGMHRDKAGAASVAGFFKVLQECRPKSLKVVGFLGCVRNSIGPDAYVTDEIVRSRAGVRVRVMNTDAEGRMAMVDLLALAKERAIADSPVDPSFYTFATLTLQSWLAFGDGYTCAMDNGPAYAVRQAEQLRDAGEKVADPIEIARIRREDFDSHRGKMDTEDVLQVANNHVHTVGRGFQGPAAFLIMASGLDKHGIDSEKPFKYTHCDIAGSTHLWPEYPSGAPVPALAAAYIAPACEIEI